MSDVEALFWRAEADPRLRSDGVVVEVLDRCPDWDRLVAAHEWAVRAVPRLGHLVVEDALRVGPPAWEPVPVDVQEHLSRSELGPDASMESVLQVAAELHMAPFDPGRPLWRSVLVAGLPGGEAAYLLKIHHSMTDGQGLVQLLDLLHGRTAEPTAHKPVARLGTPRPPVTPLSLSIHRLAGAVAQAPDRLAAAAAGVGQVMARGGELSAVGGYAASLMRVAGSVGADPSPMMGHRGLQRRLIALDAPLSGLKEAGRRAGGSLNDAYIAALLGGLRHYHLDHGADVADLPMAIPVSRRAAGDRPGGNRFAAASIVGPVSEPDPGRRIRLVRERIGRVRAEPALDFMTLAAPVVSRLPSAAITRLALRMGSSLDLQASNIPGLRRPAYIAGARVDRMYVFGPVPGSAVMATLISHLDRCHIGVAVDHDAVPDTSGFRSALQWGFDEVLELAGRVDQ